MKEFWDQHYAADEYIYGKSPNAYFKEHIDTRPPGKLLLPGEGEGRNAVYAASLGWDVHAFDQSEECRKKALQLAKVKGVIIQYDLGSILSDPPSKESFDFIGLIYFHLMPEARKMYHSLLLSALKPGGMMLLEVFSKEQIKNDSGGPKDIQLLYSVDDIMNDFNNLEVVNAVRVQTVLNEGPFHQGMADVIRYVGVKQ